jgi:hypothetical protein
LNKKENIDMNIIKKLNFKITILAGMLIIILGIWIAPNTLAESPIKLIVDGNDITATAAPLFKDGRTLVPVRFVSEELGADVAWNDLDRTVLITKGENSVLLRIDSHLVSYTKGATSYGLCDVAPYIINERTYVPLRLVSNALGVGIKWVDSSRTVYVDSEVTAEIVPFFDMKISSVKPNQVITGTTALKATFPSQVPAGATEIKFLIINPTDGKGIVAARGSQPTSSYNWFPDVKENGNKVLVAGVYDANGNFIAGDAIPIQVALEPRTSLTGVTEGQVIKDSISLGANLNFSPAYIKYQITNLDSGKVFLSAESDPKGTYKWTPLMEDNGNISIKSIAYDRNALAYESQPILAQVQVARKIALTGVTAGKTINGPVILSAARNFQVSGTEYVMLDPVTGAETILAKVGYVSYKWFPGTSLTGAREIFVRVQDTKGVTYSSSKVSVNLTGTAKLLIEGVGPGQVISGTVKMKVASNVTLNSIKYIIRNSNTGTEKVIASGSEPLVEYTYTPALGDKGNWRIRAEGSDANGKTLASDSVAVTIYTDKIYPPIPVIEKSQFIPFASNLASNSMKKSGMSAALQTAQAILESGWGQSIPVDKYNGKVSYNLFGIKGTGTLGSVTSNTWEEYNGVTYRIDDEFRAYRNVEESWTDHKKLLLTLSRYGIFRDVMNDSTQGAWALKRAGYATDSKYPIKLMNIIKQYDLEKLDQVAI